MFHARFLCILWIGATLCLEAAPLQDSALQNYFEEEVAGIEAKMFAGIDSRKDWERERPRLIKELREMLGLEPMPPRTDLKPVVTGAVLRDGIVVEKVHFQSSPGLYVTGNLYKPLKMEGRLPAVLYVCGHGPVKTNGVSFGNKVAYQHHGAWFARNGYVCLTIDTIQLGEIEGLHHGTYREGMWWWNSRGYTPAGVEAWNCIRALDYLETRPEVDKNRMGVTGRSGGGAYSWWVAALDERVKVAAPVAGITDLRDHVVDGVVEGHCDCMYFVNTHRWDYPMVPALVAPRALLIANSDKDTIFPLDGVLRTHEAVSRVYRWMGAENNLGVLITEGPHKDTQDLQLPVFRWFNRHLKGVDPLIEMAATKLFTPQELKVFEKIPEDEITSKSHDTFVQAHKPGSGPLTSDRVTEVRRHLTEKVFNGFPTPTEDFRVERKRVSDGKTEIRFNSQETVRLRMVLEENPKANRIGLLVLDENADERDVPEWFQRENTESEMKAVLFVRGPRLASDSKERATSHLRRRYMLVGQTLDTMRVWDILAARHMLRTEFKNIPVLCSGSSRHAGNLMLARIIDSDIRLGEVKLSATADKPDHLNLLRFTSWDEIERIAKWHEF